MPIKPSQESEDTCVNKTVMVLKKFTCYWGQASSNP